MCNFHSEPPLCMIPPTKLFFDSPSLNTIIAELYIGPMHDSAIITPIFLYFIFFANGYSLQWCSPKPDCLMPGSGQSFWWRLIYIGEVCTWKRQRYFDVILTSLLALATLGDTIQIEVILERLTRDKHASLLQKFVTHDRKKFYDIVLRWSKIIFTEHIFEPKLVQFYRF